MINIIELKDKVLNGYNLTKEEAVELYSADYDELCKAANEIREHFMGDTFDVCTIINAKSGSCSENCKFCAQSAHYGNHAHTYPLLDAETIVKDAKKQKDSGILRYSLVTSGKRLSDEDVEKACEIVKRIKSEVGIEVCVSFGLLNEENFQKLKDAGVTRIHNNLETSEEFFKSVCSTHSFSEKIDAIKAGQRVGMEVCSGGIIGLGETREDRIDMAFTLKELGIKSVPVNVLNPIPDTPFEENGVLSREEVNRTVAIYRFILPQSFIRLAGGRSLLGDAGRSTFLSGANASISGSLLTTSGINTDEDMQMFNELGYVPRIVDIV